MPTPFNRGNEATWLGPTAAEIAEWFPDTPRHPRPTPEQCANLERGLRHDSVWTKIVADEDMRPIRKHLMQAAMLIRDARQELEAAKTKAQRIGVPLDVATNILAAVDNFLDAVPKRGGGAPRLLWPHQAAMWAQEVADIITRPGKRGPSLNSDAGPVTTVLSRILLHVYGVEVDPSQIGRRLRDQEAKRKRRRNSA